MSGSAERKVPGSKHKFPYIFYRFMLAFLPFFQTALDNYSRPKEVKV